MSEATAHRIVWLTDGPHIATAPVLRSVSTKHATGEQYEHDVAVPTSKAVRKATRAEVEEWRVRR